MKKRLVSLLLAFSMMLTFLPVGAVTAIAEETASGEDTTVVNGTWGNNLNWSLDKTTGVLTITGSGAMKDYKYASGTPTEGWRPYKESIQSVTFGGEITSIGNYAFSECTNLNSVKYIGYSGTAGVALPESVTTIGNDAFYNCNRLSGKLTLPPSVTTIGDSAFARCVFSGDLVIPDTVTSIGSGAFSKCHKTADGELVLSKNLTEIPDYAFQECKFTGDLTIWNKVTNIGTSAFKNGQFDGKLTLSTSLKTFGSYAFQNCWGFYGDLVIPAGVEIIGYNIFDTCYYGNINGQKGSLIFAEGSQLKEIGYAAFQKCSNLIGELKLPDTVTKIGNLAFLDDTGFTGELKLPDNLQELNSSAFENCSGLNGKLTFPNKLNKISGSAFRSTRISEVIIPDSLQEFDGLVFSYSLSLKKVYLPTVVPKISINDFERSDNVKLYYPGYKDTWMTQAETGKIAGLSSSKDTVQITGYGNTWRPVCYYVDVTFNANGGTFDGSAATKTVNGEANKLYRTENLTEAMVNAVGTPNKPGYHFVGWSLSKDNGADGKDATVLNVGDDGYLTITNNGINSFGGVEDNMPLYAVYSMAASVTINDFAAADAEGYPTTIKAGENHKFTLTGDAGTDTGAKVALTLSDTTNATLQYRNSDADAWQSVGNTTFDITTVKDVQFRVTAPDDASTAEITLTATVQDATGKAIADAKNDSVTFAVKAHENATVKINTPTDTNVVAGEPSETFTVTVDEKDDTGAQAKFTLSENVDKFQYSDDNGTTWTDVDLSKAWSKDDLNGKQFRVVPKDTGTTCDATVTVTLVKADGTTEIDDAEDSVTYAVTARHHAELKLDDLHDKKLVATVPHTFTVTVTPYDDGGDATLIFDDVTGLKDSDGNPVPETGYTVTGLTKNGEAKTLTFTLTPDAESTGKTLKATLTTADCTPETTATYTVRAYGKTAVAIDGLDNGTIKAGDDKNFTVKVEPGDDAGDDADDDATVEITVSGDNKDAVDKIQYRPAGSTSDDDWKDVPADGLPIDTVNGSDFRVVTDPDAKDGDVKLTVTVKNGDTDLTHEDADFTVAKKIYSYPLTITNGKLVSVTDGETVLDIQLENGTASIPAGATVKVAFDGAAFADSGSKFGHWDITGLPQDDANKYTSQESFTFTMPAGKVTLEGMTQDSTIDDGPSIIGGIAIGATIVAGGAALTYQTYALATDFFGYLWELPYFPSNRSALALMLWQDAGKPMPESELLYPDVGQEEQDMDLQHAARWAMENELLPDKNDKDAALAPEEVKFFPNDAITKYSVLKAWKKAQELKNN